MIRDTERRLSVEGSPLEAATNLRLNNLALRNGSDKELSELLSLTNDPRLKQVIQMIWCDQFSPVDIYNMKAENIGKVYVANGNNWKAQILNQRWPDGRRRLKVYLATCNADNAVTSALLSNIQNPTRFHTSSNINHIPSAVDAFLYVAGKAKVSATLKVVRARQSYYGECNSLGEFIRETATQIRYRDRLGKNKGAKKEVKARRPLRSSPHVKPCGRCWEKHIEGACQHNRLGFCESCMSM